MDKPEAVDAPEPWTWEAICADPFLRDLPFKIELNRYNQIVMSPANNFHSRYQAEIMHLLQRLLKGGKGIPEFAVMTKDNVKVPDVVWASKQTLKAHERKCSAGPAHRRFVSRSSGREIPGSRSKKSVASAWKTGRRRYGSADWTAR